MFPKGQHIEGFNSLGHNVCFKQDIKALWRWLNDDVRIHWKLETPLLREDWIFTSDHEGNPFQSNGWDCGLYAIQVGFVLGLQVPLSKITPQRIHKYHKKPILYLLDRNEASNIMLPLYHFHEELLLESSFFVVNVNGCTH
jgi:hypothetical protein